MDGRRSAFAGKPPKLHVTHWGKGERVVLVHGGDPLGGASTFAAQKPLEQRFGLVLPDRPGYGTSPKSGRSDFERDAGLIEPLLAPGGAHLVGHSYGAVIAAWIATRRSDLVNSLALFEPPLFSVAESDRQVASMAETNRSFANGPHRDAEDVVRDFFEHVGIRPTTDLANMPWRMIEGLADDLRGMRPPSEAEISLDQLRSSAVPICVMTSGRTPGFEGIARAIASLEVAHHHVVPDVDHAVQKNGTVVNPILERFWTDAAVV